MPVTIILQGGCANQIFEYAFAYAQSRRLGVELQLDVSSFHGDSMRQYSLGLFKGVHETLVENTKANIFEDGMPYNQSVVNMIKNGDCIRGYFQTSKYFDKHRSELIDIFQPKKPLTYNGSTTRDMILDAGDSSCFLTIRRTDYVVKQEFHGVLPMNYYETALAELIKEVPELTLFVFSDEPEWCRQNLRLSVPYILAGTYDQTTPTHLGREDEDLHLMSLCKHAIMANSSFSWWGAYLSRRPDEGRIIYGPQQWFTTKDLDSRDIMLSHWRKL